MRYSLIPARRINQKLKPECKLYSKKPFQLKLSIQQDGKILRQMEEKFSGGTDYFSYRIDVSGLTGLVNLILTLEPDGEETIREEIPYEIMSNQHLSTGLIDGCWVSLVHWSDDEARHFNNGLRKLKDSDWSEIIDDMASLGIYGIVIQNMFDSTAYVHQHNLTMDNYDGRAFYDSKLFPQRYEGLQVVDPLEAILEAADRNQMQVFVGIGLFAWFDYSPASLTWHKAVAKEIYEQYGHHKSFYSFYISEELHGSFYDDYEPVPNEKWHDVPAFFGEFASFIKNLAPTKPISMAPNNILFHKHREKWLPTLKNIDILLPFAFARDLENLNIREIQGICDQTGTHFWVDMEIFQFPFHDTGLIPKDIEGLIQEIDIYRDVENIYGYQYNGMFNHPEHNYDLGEPETVELFLKYQKYFKHQLEKT